MQQSQIEVDYHSEDSDWNLSVSDDGIGTVDKLGDAKSGLGTSIVEALADQLGAKIDIQDGDPGLIISVIHNKKSAELSPPAKAA